MENLNKKVVLLVGLIGSGKSTLLEELEACGAAVIRMDDLWKQRIYTELFRKSLKNIFGEDVLYADGSPRITTIRNLLFSRRKEDRQICLERQTNLFKAFSDIFVDIVNEEIWVQLANPAVTMVILESATALMADWHSKLAPIRTVALHCNEKIRLTRLLKRNTEIDTATYLAIMQMQQSDHELLKVSTDIGAINCYTECSVAEMKQKARDLYKQLQCSDTVLT